MDHDVLQNIKFTWANETGVRGGLGTCGGEFKIRGFDSTSYDWFEGIATDEKNNRHLIYGIYEKGIGIELFETLKDGTSYRFVGVKTIGEEAYHGQFYVIDSIENIDGIDAGLSRIEVEPRKRNTLSGPSTGISGTAIHTIELLGEIDHYKAEMIGQNAMLLYQKVQEEFGTRKKNLGRLYTEANGSKKLKL